ncbi:MAG TPA: hypothetical protein VLI54_05070 [Bacillota bacterium]|nr:hypothetical protein [Bacillota bacterium]
MRHSIGRTRNGMLVYVDLINSKAGIHIAQQPYLLGLLKQALAGISAKGVSMSIEHDMGRSVGYNFVVKTTEKDTVLYARLLRDELYTRFVKNGKPLATTFISMVLERDTDKNYELRDAWIGRLTPPRPGSDQETVDSKQYWAEHAYVLDNQSLQLRTVTKTCPYEA